jgi:hypothetical protein
MARHASEPMFDMRGTPGGGLPGRTPECDVFH